MKRFPKVPFVWFYFSPAISWGKVFSYAVCVSTWLPLGEIDRVENIPRKIVKDRQNPFNLEHHEFIKNFRLDKELVLYVTEHI